MGLLYGECEDQSQDTVPFSLFILGSSVVYDALDHSPFDLIFSNEFFTTDTFMKL